MDMTRRQRALLVGIMAAICAATVVWFLFAPRGPHTASDVALSEVEGSGRPAHDATHISYWSFGNYLAEYTSSESALRQRYPDFVFTEITNSTEYPRLAYGDPEKFPPSHPPRAKSVAVTNGIEHHAVWENGGGYDIVFDRISKRVFIWMAPN